MSKMDVEKMFALAKAVRLNAYAPYSNFLVGSCIYTDDDQYYVGCNVENTSYRMTDCAETVAIGAMVANGVRRIKAVLVVTDTPKGVAPCGGCLQKLSEFVSEDTMVYIANVHAITEVRNFTEFFGAGFAKEFIELQGRHA